MIISGNVIAHKIFANGEEVFDTTSCTLPPIEKDTTEIKGAGIMGSFESPVTGQIKPMTFSISARGVNSRSSELAKPGLQNLEVRFLRDVIQADGSTIPEGSKIFITGINKKYDPGKIENSSTMDGSIDFEVIRYRQIINGVETLLIDKVNYIYKINGIDYMEKVRAAL